jgi:hypothetical protein
VLEGGYKEFFSKHPELCAGTYVAMADKEFKASCKEEFSKCRRMHQQFSAKQVSFRLANQP